MSGTSRRRLLVGAGVLAVAVGFTGTALAVDLPRISGIEELPLPGGADLGDHPVELTAEFTDVLSLVPQSAVKFNDVSVGRVAKVRLGADGWTARVTMRINGDVRLPSAPYARIEQSSLLGEKYVQLVAPPRSADEQARQTLDASSSGPTKGSGGGVGPSGTSRDGAADVDIPLARTNRNPEVEEVLGALSMLLNGGGVNQLKTISKELNDALAGNEPQVRSMLRRVEKLVKNLDGHRTDITRALDGVNRLSTTLASRRDQIADGLTGLSPGLKVLSKQRGQLMRMLGSLEDLSDVAVDTVDRSKDDLVADLRALAPTLRGLADAGQDLPDSLQVLFTYPFTDEVLRGVKGDYLNVYLDMTAVPGTQVIPPIEESEPPPAADEESSRTSGTALDSLPPVALPSVDGAGTETSQERKRSDSTDGGGTDSSSPSGSSAQPSTPEDSPSGARRGASEGSAPSAGGER